MAEQGQRLDDAAAGAEHLVALIRDDDAGPRARGDVIDDLVGQIMHVDDGFADAGIAELVEHMIEQRAAGHAHQRLWHPVGQGAHAHAKSGGEDHGFGGFDGHFGNFCEPIRISGCRFAIIITANYSRGVIIGDSESAHNRPA